VYDILTLGMLMLLLGLVFHAGYQFAIPRVTEKVIEMLREDQVIRLVEDEDGEMEIYSGYKFYQDKRK